ncbi:MAG: hypothetical protein LQ345_003908, partial [Seirophora villosa]
MFLNFWRASTLFELLSLSAGLAVVIDRQHKHLPTRQLSSSQEGRPTASISVQEIDYHWVTNVSIGGQTVVLTIDSGSSPTWVSTPQADKKQGRTYDIGRSPTARPHDNEHFTQEFPSSSVSGIVVDDTIVLGAGDVVLENFALGVVSQASAGIKDQAFDGFLGFGFRGSNPKDTKPTFFESLLPTLEAPVFAFDLSSAATSSGRASIALGGIDTTKFQPPLSQTPIDRSTNRWTANGIQFSIQGHLMEERANLVFEELKDTGGDNYINAPFSVTDEYYRHVEGLRWGSQLGRSNCAIIIPCASKLPDLQMHVGDGVATIRGDAMIGKPLTGPSNPAWAMGSGILCLPTLQPFDPNGRDSCPRLGLIGAPFFHANYVVFNHAEPSVAFAPYA